MQRGFRFLSLLQDSLKGISGLLGMVYRLSEADDSFFTVGSRLYFVMVGAKAPGDSMAAPLHSNSSEARLVLYTGLRVWTAICLPRQAIW